MRYRDLEGWDQTRASDATFPEATYPELGLRAGGSVGSSLRYAGQRRVPVHVGAWERVWQSACAPPWGIGGWRGGAAGVRGEGAAHTPQGPGSAPGALPSRQSAGDQETGTWGLCAARAAGPSCPQSFRSPGLCSLPRPCGLLDLTFSEAHHHLSTPPSVHSPRHPSPLADPVQRGSWVIPGKPQTLESRYSRP